VDTPHEQALIPLFARHEFANADAAELAARVQRAPYAREFDAAFSGAGERVFDDPQRVVKWLAMALEVFQQSAPDFYPYTSKYDAVLRHEATLTPAETRGLAVFNDPAKGNCASCHMSALGSGGGFPRFTDSAYAALGVPRNRSLPANRDARHFDLGLCGNGRTGLADKDEYCGRFKTPTLRNVATRQSFFHNGVFHSLREVLEFYAQRDTRPERWYPRDAKGRVQKYNDLPEKLRANVIETAPFGGKPGDKPAMSAAEIEDVLAFLGTLNDGWKAPAKPR
jgi:cytochrome c peroxidase